jgi:hypothetical protein
MDRHDKAKTLPFTILQKHLKMTQHKLRSGVNWQGALKQKSAKQTGVKQGQSVHEKRYTGMI